jgi:hypothetical protein
MAEQNFIVKILRVLGEDRFTTKSTREALKEAYDKAKRDPEILDVHNGRYILFSDHHRGAKNRADDFRACEAIYCAALAYYFALDYSLCVMGLDFRQRGIAHFLMDVKSTLKTEQAS